MADVLIVCVREDEPQAKALAEMFEAAGFSIGGAPSSDGALRSSGAGVVVWSQASIRSRPFLDAAQRVINANKAVVASLIEPPPPSSIGDSPAFDLSRWDGDPNDPSLDPLFFAVDRMVNSARASVGGGAAAREPYEPPAPPPRAPAPAYREPPPPRAEPPRADPLRSETEHWRSIRDSRNPADFMDYLSRYGPDGAFAEVAELRLKQLTATPERSPPPRAAPAPARPAPRAETPRRADPPPRRTDPPRPAPAPRLEATRRPPPERTFDRAELREPSRSEGGALRAFVLIALLGGAALAGGLYFGGGLGDMSASPPEQADAAEAPSTAGEPADYAGADSTPFGDAVEARPPETRPERPTPPPETTRDRAREPEAPAPRTPPPTQVASVAPPPSTSGGPVSLTPGGEAAAPPSTIVPLRPSPSETASVEPPAITPSQPPPATLRGTSGSVQWARRPTARRIAELYPARALREGVGGRVQLDCTVLSNLSVSCRIASETPAGAGFGAAALSAANAYRAQPTLSDGSSAVGTTTRIAVNFQAPQ